jgi:glycosyltransferase involved in cell wall biosynthesis
MSAIAWEVLVVDNNSLDQTRAVVQSFCQRYAGRFRYVFEPTPGKSYALNSGIADARGQVLAFVDDDVSVEPTWLQNLTGELLRDPSLAGIGGRTLPAGDFARPPWLSKNMTGWGEAVFAYFDMGDKPIALTRPPYGANMAFRKSIFDRYGGFRADLGPSPGSQIRNEDTEFGRRVMAAGERLRYEPSAVVYHPLPQGRITQEYFFSWWFDYGRALMKERGDRPNLFGIRWDYWSLLARFAEISIRTLGARFSPRPSKRFDFKCKIWRNKGQIAEIRRRLAEPPKGKTPDRTLAAER